MGEKFADESNPRVVFQMGKTGTSGVIEVTDIAFDVADVLPGAILVENNIAGRNPGDVGLWDSHFRAGGTAGSAVETKCGSYPPHIADCKAAFMFLHLRPESSTYMESVWGWSVNRDLDGLTGQTNGTSQSIAVGRGMLIESTRGTWLVGTAFEHFVLYQYQLVNARNVFSLMAQTETVYWQPTPSAPAPWMLVSLPPCHKPLLLFCILTPLFSRPDPKYSDPDYSNCDGTSAQCYMGWSLRIIGGHDLTFYGLAFWQVSYLANLLIALLAFSLYASYLHCIILITQYMS
jgi:glucan 1,3-beta-glucosidase